jgi:hypothetical protein
MGDRVRNVVRAKLEKDIRLVELEFRPYLSSENRERRGALRNRVRMGVE